MKIYPIALISILVLFSSCASKNKKYADNIPVWVYEPYESCNKEKEFCASGDGNSFKESDANALESIASIFRVDIKSSFNLFESELKSSDYQEVTSSAEKEISKNIDFILESAVILKKTKQEKMFFSLASLNKKKIATLTRLRIQEIDRKMNYYISLKNKIYLKKILSLYNERLVLNERLLIISGVGKKAPFTFSQIKKLKETQGSKSKIQIRFMGEEMQVAEKKIKEIFEEVGYQVVDDNTYDYLITIRNDFRKMHLNVRGFEKYEQSLFVDAKNRVGTKKGSLVVSIQNQGRSKNNILIKNREQLLLNFENKIHKLNLD